MGATGETGQGLASWERETQSVFYPKNSKEPSGFKQRDKVIRSGRKTPLAAEEREGWRGYNRP